MQDVGLMTCYLNNYGACLQAYALLKSIEKCGHECLIIRYTPDRSVKEYGIFVTMARKGKYMLKSLVDKGYLYENFRMKKFHDFRKKYLKFTSENYKEIEDLYKYTPEFDCFVVGSDQLWNPRIHGNRNNRAYFLDFVPLGKRKIAYAPSIGTESIPDECEKEMSDLLRSFYAVSVREKQGKAIIDEITDKSCRVVLDPTLLLTGDEWRGLTSGRIIKRPYVFCYCFGERPYIFEFIEHVKSRLNMEVVTIPLNRTEYGSAYVKMKKAGPIEFLNLILNASLVITDSFHATAFSINLNVPFYSLLRNEEGEDNNMNSRIYNILEFLELKERLIEKQEMFPELISTQIDFSKSNRILEEKRKEDAEFLERAMNGSLF